MVDATTRLAQTVLGKNLKVRPGETVVLDAWSHSLPYLRPFVQEVRRLGGRPTVLYEDEDAWWRAIDERRLSGFTTLSPAEKALVESADVFLHFWGPEDRPRFDALPDKVAEKVVGFNEEWYRSARKAKLRGCRMTLGQATDPAAQKLGFNGPSWRARLLKAGAVPAEGMHTRGVAIAKRLRTGKRLRIRHSNGTDLELRLGAVHTRVDSGLVDTDAMKRAYGQLANNPSGQVLAAIDDNHATGTFVSNRSVYLGADVFGGVRWRFEDGRLVSGSCRLGTALYNSRFKAAGKGRDRLGVFSIGLNPLSRALAPCEDTEEGAVLVGIGNNGFLGGRNRLPFLAYGLLGDARIEIDGRVIADRGHVR